MKTGQFGYFVFISGNLDDGRLWAEVTFHETKNLATTYINETIKS